MPIERQGLMFGWGKFQLCVPGPAAQRNFVQGLNKLKKLVSVTTVAFSFVHYLAFVRATRATFVQL